MGETAIRPLAFDLSARAKLRIRGADALRFLNGQLTNDIRKASGTIAIRAAILNVKGHMNADVFVHTRGDAVILDTEASARATLAARLERYIIADDVQVEDATDEFALFHVLAPIDPPARTSTVAADRFGSAGSDIWAAADERSALRDRLSAECVLLDGAETETFRIERGIPRWGYELSEDIIPVEAELESSAIDYAKGCYIGQEVISRMKMSGQTNKRLCGLVSLSGDPLENGMRLSTLGDPRREVGRITSATRSARLARQIALGFVKRGHNTPGTHLAAGETFTEVEVAPLPFL